MQAVEITGAILQEQGRRMDLTCRVAALEERGVVCGKSCFHGHALVPNVRNLRKMWVEPRSQLLDQAGQRIGKVLVFAPAEAMAGHPDVAPKASACSVPSRDLATIARRAEARQYCPAVRV